MCSSAYIHGYRYPLIAALFQSYHVNFDYPKLWICESSIPEKDDGLKIGVTYLKTLKEIELPEFTLDNYCYIAIKLALVHPEFLPENWITWAENWLSGKDRSREVADELRAPMWDMVTAMGDSAQETLTLQMAWIAASAGFVTDRRVLEITMAATAEYAAKLDRSKAPRFACLPKFTTQLIKILEESLVKEN